MICLILSLSGKETVTRSGIFPLYGDEADCEKDAEVGGRQAKGCDGKGTKCVHETGSHKCTNNCLNGEKVKVTNLPVCYLDTGKDLSPSETAV